MNFHILHESTRKIKRTLYICGSPLPTNPSFYIKYLNSSKEGCDRRHFRQDLMKEEREMSPRKPRKKQESPCVFVSGSLLRNSQSLTSASRYTLVHWTCLALSPAKTIGLPRTSKYSYLLKKMFFQWLKLQRPCWKIYLPIGKIIYSNMNMKSKLFWDKYISI